MQSEHDGMTFHCFRECDLKKRDGVHYKSATPHYCAKDFIYHAVNYSQAEDMRL